MGQGFGDGYHQCNRGPVSDYYNPYSAHNSVLQSSTYPYVDPYSERISPAARFNRGIPGADNSGWIYNDLQGDAFQGSSPRSRPQPQTKPKLRPMNRPGTGGNKQDKIINGPLDNSAEAVENDSVGVSPQRGFFQTGFRSKPLQSPRSANRFTPFLNQN
jgi:hypothetical protein